MQTKLLTPLEVAQLKKVTKSAVYAAIAQGRLPHQRFLNRLAVKESDALNWNPLGVKSGRPPGTPMSEAARANISRGQKRRWSRRQQKRQQ